MKQEEKSLRQGGDASKGTLLGQRTGLRTESHRPEFGRKPDEYHWSAGS